MILDILYFSKDRPLRIQRTDARKFASDIAMTFEGRLQAKKIRFDFRPDPSIKEIDMDATVMRTALLNILDNAADACREEKSGRESKIAFGVRLDGDYHIFDIIDNGVGMDKPVTENIFDLFFSSKGHRGTGLGLFVAHRIVTKHQGTIHVSSKKGAGSHFRVVLPTQQ